MKIVTCTRPNASTLINGVKFSACPEGMISESVDDAVADDFCSIPGFTAAAVGESDTAADALPEAEAKAEAAPEAKPAAVSVAPRKKMGK